MGPTKRDNHAELWQFDHIVPIVFFDLSKEADLKLCWNFTNIRVEPINLDQPKEFGMDVLGAKKYFEDLYNHSGLSLAKKMVEKIEGIDQELQLSDQAFAFIESQSQLSENTLTSKSLFPWLLTPHRPLTYANP